MNPQTPLFSNPDPLSGPARYLLHHLLIALLIYPPQAWAAVPPGGAADNPLPGAGTEITAVPPAPTAAGDSSGVTANGFSGEASYTLPIAIPPGTGGLSPEIALRYGSRGGNGVVGQGWRVDLGFPAVIARDTRYGAPKYTSADTFLLAGQPLRPLPGGTRYVSENFDFSRIEWVASPSPPAAPAPDPDPGSWRVLRPDGARLYYGYHATTSFQNAKQGSRLDSVEVRSARRTRAACPADGEDCFRGGKTERIVSAGIPFAWYLDRIEDRHGNFMIVSWSSLGDPGTRYPTRIRYGYHQEGAVTTTPGFGGAHDGTLSTQRQVVFSYERSRKDDMPVFRAGLESRIRHRLSRIPVDYGLGNSAQRLRRYTLTYQDAEERRGVGVTWGRRREGVILRLPRSGLRARPDLASCLRVARAALGPLARAAWNASRGYAAARFRMRTRL